jgi:hypothetical protein
VWVGGADEESVVSLGRCGVCSGVPKEPFRQGGSLGKVVGGGVYTLPNCVMIFVRAYAAARRPREPDGHQVEDPPRFDALHPPVLLISSTRLLASSMTRLILKANRNER